MSEIAGTGVTASRHVHHDIDRILIDRGRIAKRVEELGAEIQGELEHLPGDVDVVLIPVLTGAMIFVADLMRHLPQKLRIGLLTARSYGGRTTQSSGDPILSALPESLENKYVLIIDDVLDSGTTIRRIRAAIEDRGPLTVRVCVLLRKNRPSAHETPCEYVGFDIPDAFVVGYGLDYDDQYRNLPDIGLLKKEAL